MKVLLTKEQADQFIKDWMSYVDEHITPVPLFDKDGNEVHAPDIRDRLISDMREALTS